MAADWRILSLGRPVKLTQSVSKGATRGVRAWLAYGAIEFALGTSIPALFGPPVDLPNWQLLPLGILLVAYGIAGAVLGGAAGALLALQTPRQDDGIVYDSAAVLPLPVVFIINLVPYWRESRSEHIALCIAAILASALAGALFSETWRRHMAFLANSWAVAVSLLSFPFISEECLPDSSPATKFAVSALGLLAVLTLALLWSPRRPNTIARAAAARYTGFATLIVLAFAKPTDGLPRKTAKETTSGRPNIVLITMDTVRADHLSLYGYERDTTPNLLQLSREATTYNRMTATAAFTLPTHASLFTGVYPGWHGAYIALPSWPAGRPIDPGRPTLAEILRSHGYRTGAVVGNYVFLDVSKGMAKGFEEYQEHAPLHLSNLERPFYLREGALRLLASILNTDAFYASHLRASDINRRAFAWLQAGKPQVPFFLFLNYMDAHEPYSPPAPFDARFRDGRPRFKWFDYPALKRAVIGGEHRLTKAEKRALISQYDGGIAYVDSEIGRLLTHLRELGLYENTLIIVTADHGEAFGEHDLMEHALGSVYEDQIRIPLLIKYPGQREVRRCDFLASQVDILPTVLDVAGYPAPAGVQGKSLRLPRRESDAVFAESQTTSGVELSPRFRGIRRAILTGDLKLETWTVGPPELYDLSVDPGEEHNLYTPGNPRAAALLSRLASWTASIPRLPDDPPKPHTIDIERLKSLGYAQ
jgi:arylsulfatase A-like enzyme